MLDCYDLLLAGPSDALINASSTEMWETTGGKTHATRCSFPGLIGQRYWVLPTPDKAGHLRAAARSCAGYSRGGEPALRYACRRTSWRPLWPPTAAAEPSSRSCDVRGPPRYSLRPRPSRSLGRVSASSGDHSNPGTRMRWLLPSDLGRDPQPGFGPHLLRVALDEGRRERCRKTLKEQRRESSESPVPQWWRVR